MDRLNESGADPDKVAPWQVSAVLVGIETYRDQSPDLATLPGPAHDALGFAAWLRAHEVPAGNIALLLAPTAGFADEADREARALGVGVRKATIDAIREAYYDLARTDGSSLLITFWGGHGALSTQDMQRYLYFAEAAAGDPRAMRVEDLRHLLLQQEFQHLQRQVFLFDACARHLRMRGPAPVRVPFRSGDLTRRDVRQFVLHASQDGRGAVNDPAAGGSPFARLVLDHLTADPKSVPPDVEALAAAVEEHFAHPGRSAFLTQTRVAIRYRNYTGSEREMVAEPLPVGGERRPATSADLPVTQLWQRSARHIAAFAGSLSDVGRHGGLPRLNVQFTTTRCPVAVPVRAASPMIRPFYEAVPDRRLAVTGPGGSGKTHLAVQLAQELVENRDEHEPVPVLLTLVNWRRAPADLVLDGSQSAYRRLTDHFERWLADQLVSHELCDDLATARSLVGGRWVLPVLDGLDEVRGPEATGGPAGAVTEVVTAINCYTTAAGSRPAPVVVTARTPQESASLDALTPICVVEMQRLSVPEIRQGLYAAIPGYAQDAAWAPVRADLERGDGSIAARRLDSPWKLALAVKALTSRPAEAVPAELVHEGPGADEALHEKLLAAYVPAACRDTVLDPPTPPDAEAAVRWLAELARHLERTGSEDITLSRIWRMAGVRRVRWTQAAVHTVLVPLFGLACLLAALGGAGHAVGTVRRLLDGGVDMSGATGRRVIAAGVFAGAVTAAGLVSAMGNWSWVPRMSRRTRSLRERRQGSSRLRVMLRVLSGAEIGSAIGLALGIACYLLFGVRTALTVGTAVGLPLGYGMEAKVGLDRTLSGNFTAVYYWMWDLAGLAVGAAVCAPLFWSLDYSPARGAVFGAAVGYFGAFAIGLIGWLRYVVAMTILYGQRRLPWKVASFLDWAHRAGVLRVHGASWQFRHTDLQRWHAALPPSPPPQRRRPGGALHRVRRALPRPE